MEIPHEGGRRFSVDDPEYQILRNWIQRDCRQIDTTCPASFVWKSLRNMPPSRSPRDRSPSGSLPFSPMVRSATSHGCPFWNRLHRESPSAAPAKFEPIGRT
ncbi:MAG: hypothetical protein KDA96_20385, partial [Planctomycetaceae bacterium]|nr:hypothetical protein [Planctomycetaceae bacterium]